MKVLTSQLNVVIILIVLIPIVLCSIDSKSNANVIENREEDSKSVQGEEAQEEVVQAISATSMQLSPSLINTCRSGYRLTEAGDCRRIFTSTGIKTSKRP